MTASRHDFSPPMSMENAINLSGSYVMPYSFQVHGFDFAYRNDLAGLCRLTIGLKKLGLLLKAQISPVPVIVIACYAFYPVGFIPRDKYCYILRVESGLLADFAISFPFRSHGQCFQSLVYLLVPILLSASLQFLLFFFRKYVFLHFASPGLLYHSSSINSIFLMEYEYYTGFTLSRFCILPRAGIVGSAE